MARIRIDTERVREVGQQFLANAQEITEIRQRLERSIDDLDTWVWDGRSKAKAEPLLGRVRPTTLQLNREFEELGYKLARIANTFEYRDNTVVIVEPPKPWWEQLKNSVQEIDLNKILGFAVAAVDSAIYSLLNQILPQDIDGANEYLALTAEGKVTIPLIELGLPFSGYLSGENGITLIRDDETGEYRVIIGRADSLGADLSHDKVGANVGVRQEQGYEFAFNPDTPGDLAKMAWLISSLAGSQLLAGLGIPGLSQLTEGISTASLKDNLITASGGIGFEVEGEVEATEQEEVEFEHTEIVGIEKRRDDLTDDSWESVTSYKFTNEVNANIEVLEVLAVEGELSSEFTVNKVIDTATGQESVEVVLEIQPSAGGKIDIEKIKELLPGVDTESGDITGGIKITYELTEPVENVINALKEGNLDPILNNSELTLETSVGTSATVDGELDAAVNGQKIGVELEGSTSSGYTTVASTKDKD